MVPARRGLAKRAPRGARRSGAEDVPAGDLVALFGDGLFDGLEGRRVASSKSTVTVFSATSTSTCRRRPGRRRPSRSPSCSGCTTRTDVEHGVRLSHGRSFLMRPRPKLVEPEGLRPALAEVDGDAVDRRQQVRDLTFPRRGLDDRAALGRPLAERDVHLVLVLEAAHETPAAAGDLGGVERQVLVFGHADGDGLLVAGERGAAEAAAAGAVAADDARLVAGAHLLELDAATEPVAEPVLTARGRRCAPRRRT